MVAPGADRQWDGYDPVAASATPNPVWSSTWQACDLRPMPADTETLHGAQVWGTGAPATPTWPGTRRAADVAAALHAARDLLDRGDLQEAELAYQRVLELDPKNATAMVGHARCLRLQKRAVRAQLAVSDALSQYPGAPALLEEQGFLHADNGHLDRALQCWMQAVATASPGADWEASIVEQLSLLRAAGQMDGWRKLLLAALARAPTRAVLLDHRGSLAFNDGDIQQALVWWLQALNGEGDATGKVSRLADNLLTLTATGQVTEAIELASEALRAYPQRTWLLFRRGNAYLSQGALSDALKDWYALPESLGSDSDLDITLVAAAFTLSEKKCTPEAIALLRSALAAHPSLEVRTELVRLLIAERAFDEAIDACIGPQDDDEILLEGLRVAPAVETSSVDFADAALRRRPRSAPLLYHCARLYAARSHWAEAEDALEALLQLPNAPDAALAGAAHAQRVAIARERGAFDEAHERLRIALSAFPHHAEVVLEHARLLIAEARFDEAVATLTALPDPCAVLEEEVEGLRSTHQYGVACPLLRAGRRRLPQCRDLLELEGWLEVERRHVDRAIALWLTAVDHSSEVELAGRLQRLRDQKLLGKAEQLVSAARARYPKSTALHLLQGWMHFQRRRYDAAGATWLEAVAAAPQRELKAEAILEALNALLSQSQARAAERLATTALERFPAHDHLMLARGVALNQLQRFDEAMEHLDRVLQRCASLRGAGGSTRGATNLLSLEPYAEVNKARALRGKRAFTDAAAVLAKGLAREPSSYILLLERGWLAYDQNQLAQADADFEAAALANDDGCRIRAYYLSITNRTREATEVLAALCEKAPDDVALRESLGFAYLRSNQPEKAEQQFSRLLTVAPDMPEGETGMGALRVSQERFAEAEEHFRKALALASFTAVVHTNLAWVIARQCARDRGGSSDLVYVGASEASGASTLETRLAEAERECREALKLDGPSAFVFQTLGYIEFLRGNVHAAEAQYLKAIPLTEGDDDLASELGALYLQMGRHADAERYLLQALAANADNVEAHLELGSVRLRTRQTDDAIREFQTAVSLRPGAARPHRALAIALMEKGELGDAERVLRSALQRVDEPRRGTLHLTLSQLLVQRGDDTHEPQYYEEALREVTKALRLRPADPRFHMQAGLVRHKLGDVTGAIEAFEACRKHDPKNVDALRNLELLKRPVVDTIQRFVRSGSLLLAALAIVQLALVWWGFLHNPAGQSARITPALLGALLPIFLGLFVIAFLLPALAKLKLPGFEAELSQPKPGESLSVGPRGRSLLSGPRTTT